MIRARSPVELDEEGRLSPHAYTYDAENRIVATNGGAAYSYDAGGQRVVKSLGGSTTEYFYFGGLPIAELNGSTWSDYVFAGSKRIAVSTSAGSQDPAGIQAAASTYYFHGDQLGSARMMTTGTILTDPSTPWYATYAPFGQLVYGSLPSHYKFTGKERDDETTLDYFGARYYASAEGRFLTPDWSATPETVPYGHFENPQSLNLYAYVKNNPIADMDADGHVSPEDATGMSGFPEEGDQGVCLPGACGERSNNTAGTESPTADLPAQNQIPLGGAPPAPSVPPQAFDDAHVNNMTVRQVGNVVANENRDVTPGTSSPQALQEAKTAQANAVMNADYQYGANRQNVVPTAPATDPNHLASTPQGQQALQAARTAFVQQGTGTDPTGNRVFFNNRFNDNAGPRTIGNQQQTVFKQYGPFTVGGGPVYALIYNNP